MGQKVSRLGDLQPALLATVLAKCLPFLTEHTLFSLGGELLEVSCLELLDFMLLRFDPAQARRSCIDQIPCFSDWS